MIQGFDMLGKSLGKDQRNGDEQPIWPAIFDVTWKSRCWLVMRWLMCTLFCSGIAEAGVVNDPTVPPAEWLALQPTPAGKAASVVEPPMEIQVVIIGRARKLAVIDGQIVRVGDEHKGSKVLAIRSDQVVKAEVEKSLLMTPDVIKKAPIKVHSQKEKIVVSPISDETPKTIGANK